MMTTAQEFERRRSIAPALLCSRSSSLYSTPRSSMWRCRRSAPALDFSQQSLPWVVNAYVLTFGGFLLLGGRLADLLGPGDDTRRRPSRSASLPPSSRKPPKVST